jgi:Flp pilus assembly pilin Flp
LARELLLRVISTSRHTAGTSKGSLDHATTSRASVEDGQALVEYAAILALVFAVVVVAYGALGTATLGLFQQVTGALGL